MAVLKVNDELKRAILKTNVDAMSANDCIPTNDKAFELFYCDGSSSPTGSDGFIISIKYSAPFVKQIFIDDNNKFGNIYMRTLNNNYDNPTWESWYKASGDYVERDEDFEIQEWYGGGFTTDGSSVRVTVPVNKNLSKVKSIVLNNLGGLHLFKATGGTVQVYIGSVSVSYIRENYITFNIVSSGLGSNVPVGIKIDNLNLTFKVS